MGSWAHLGPAMTAAFLASVVEAVEALTIVLAVATVRGWRPAGLGALAGLTVRGARPLTQACAMTSVEIQCGRRDNRAPRRGPLVRAR
jgi:uncharacterized membrane protein